MAEAACYLSGVTSEEDICLASKVVNDACKGDSTHIFIYEEEKQSLWSDDGTKDEKGEDYKTESIIDPEAVENLMASVIETSEAQRLDGTKFVLLALPARNEVGKVVGVLQIKRFDRVDPSINTTVKRFTKENLAVCNFISTLIGQAIERVRVAKSERNTLKQSAKKSQTEMRRMQDQILKTKINLEHKMFVDAKVRRV